MNFSQAAERLRSTEGKWEMHLKVRELASKGADVIELTLGEPDVEVPEELKASAINAILRGRTKYAAEQGEPELLNQLAAHYTERSGRLISTKNVLCFPGTQTALFATIMALVGTGDEVLVCDPMYATYDAVVRASGAKTVPVWLRPEQDFKLQVADLESRVSTHTKVLLLTNPHNPTGRVFSEDTLNEIVDFALRHQLWIVSDEVYADLIFDNVPFVSPLQFEQVGDRVVVVSSISKSHAAPGFRSGWCIGSEEFIKATIPLCDTMLFGNQPFIADMTVDALRNGSSVIAGMRSRYSARADELVRLIDGSGTGLTAHRPQAGMFALIDVSKTGMDGATFARSLLNATGVAVMPGASFGASIDGFVRVTLTAQTKDFVEGIKRMISFCSLTEKNLSEPKIQYAAQI